MNKLIKIAELLYNYKPFKTFCWHIGNAILLQALMMISNPNIYEIAKEVGFTTLILMTLTYGFLNGVTKYLNIKYTNGREDKNLG